MSVKQRPNRGKGDPKLKEPVPANPAAEPAAQTGWISMRSGRMTITIVSAALAIFTGWQVIPVKGLAEGILLGVVLGGSIWVVFFGILYLNRFARRR